MVVTAESPPIGSHWVRQCAWCCRVQDHHGQYGQRLPRLLRYATHGICPPCKARFLAELEAHAGTATAA
jgi:hypothetical protein